MLFCICRHDFVHISFMEAHMYERLFDCNFIWLSLKNLNLLLNRQLHVMDETHVLNQVKEDVCYVSQEFYKDMEIAQ